MAPPSAPTEPIPSAPPALAFRTGTRPWGLVALVLVSIGLLAALATVLLLAQRDAALDLATARAQREVRRLAAELDQSLRLGRAAIEVSRLSPGLQPPQLLGDHRPLVDTLSLPFELHRQPAGGSEIPVQTWVPELARQESGRWVLPFLWRPPGGGPSDVYELWLPRDAVLARFESEGLPAGGSMSLFRLEPDGATTVLARHPMVAQEQGHSFRGHVANALDNHPTGVFRAAAMIDGVERIVGYQRLGGEADRLVVVYALSVDSVLAGWQSILPLAWGLTLLVAAAMAYGAWRLHRSMRALARSEHHLQTLTDHMPDVVVRYDKACHVLYANPAIEMATGLKPDALIGRPITALGAPPDNEALWTDCLHRVFATGRAETLYFSHHAPAGMRHWESQARLEPAAPGEEPTVLVITRDITERHEAEALRHSARQLFETAFQAAPEAMSLSEWHSGRLLLVNDAFCELFGRSREQLVGQSSSVLGLWHSSTRRQRLIDALESGEEVRDIAGSSPRPDGQMVHVRYSAERVQRDGGDCLLLMFRDVTQLEREQRALVRSEQRFRLAASHGQVWERDFVRDLIQPSDEFFLNLGHRPPEQKDMKKAIAALIHPGDRPRLLEAARRYLKGEAEFRVEYRAIDAQGRVRWFDTRGSGLRNAMGRVTYMAGTTFEITDRKALEEAQRQTLKHLDTVANASAGLAWTVDDQKHPDWLNQAWLDFTGRDLATECETFWLEDLHPQDRERCEKTFDENFEARRPYSMEYRLRRHDGVYRWVHEQGKPRYDADQRFIGYVGSCLDVTDLREAEATARERDATLKQVFDVLKDMLFVVDAQERFVFFQAGTGDRLYRRPDEFLGRTISEVMPPPLVPRLQAAMHQARAEGLQELDYSLELPGGTHHFNARLAWLPGGDQCMFLVRDTTEQQVARRERERMNDFVLLLFRLASRFINLPLQHMDEAIDAALGDMGVFVGADRAYLFAYNAQANTATNTHEWCAPGIAPQKPQWQGVPIGGLSDWYQMHLRGEKILVADTRTLPAGALRDLLDTMEIRGLLTLPLRHDDTCLGFVGLDSVHQAREYGQEEITLLELFGQMLVNMQLRAQAAAQVREMTERLEQKVEERTRQLHDSVQRLQVVNRELESFTYSASHDLRTPLRGIEGFSALLLEEHAQQLDEQGREYLRRIQRATLHMSRLVSDLLAYSRLQQMTEQIAPVDLAACVRDVAAPFRDELEARQGRLETPVPGGVRVLADPKGLAIALRNLIDNALKFTPAGQAPQIRIEAQTRGDRVLLSVADQGIGFDMKHHDRIFGMFQRLHRQDQIPGTGIGLALVLKAVERMGGTIRAESATGQGACFEIDLPLA
ncbi:PAS domain S-box protein [Hydrogenophaga pseudoflava]|uniref:PAS domain S-box protein n=1 Tax=Hydrogenophaga pseudoflava TaxID=47421 RepID=UPI0027E44076|nr:PAS domain S-box protein [Hydrogenophaga pseudoflava]MDQ7745135.1 PAS domain S-box protein [Hydrogenophaga pseudoflava]